MTVREYIGARYVPLFIGNWDNTVAYEPLSIVQYQGASYTSRQAVPIGIDIANETYWAQTGNYNAQVEQYRQEVQTFDGRIAANASAIDNINEIITDNAITGFRDSFLKIPFGSIPYPANFNTTFFNQGACIVEESNVKYLYACTNNDNEQLSYIYKINLSTGSIAEPQVLPSAIAHPNDIVFDSTRGYLVIASAQSRGSAEYYAFVYNYVTNTVINTYSMPPRCFNLAYDEDNNVFYSVNDPNPWTGGVLYKLDSDFNVLSTVDLNFAGGFTPQCLVYYKNKLFLGYCSDNITSTNKYLVSDGEGIIIFKPNGEFITNIYGEANGELESISPYDEYSMIVGYHVNRYGSAFSSQQFFRVYYSNPPENDYPIFIWNNYNGNMNANNNIYIDSSNTNFFSDGSSSHPFKRFAELTNMNQCKSWIYIIANGTFTKDTLFLQNARVKIDGNNNTSFNGAMFFDQCSYVDFRNIILSDDGRTDSYNNSVVQFAHCQYIFMRGVTINNSSNFDYLIELFGCTFASDTCSFGTGNVSSILNYASEVYLDNYVPITESHSVKAPMKIFDYSSDGTWSKGETKNIFAINKYQFFVMYSQGAATPMFGFRTGSNIRFAGGYCTDNTYTSHAATITLSGTNATLVEAEYMAHNASNSHGASTDISVGQIWAIC